MTDKNVQHLTPRQYTIQFVKFTLFSITAGLIQMGSGAALHELTPLPYWPVYLIALILSVVYNFTINRHFTFKSVTNIPIAMAKVAGYYLVFTPLSTWWGVYLTDIKWNFYVIFVGTMAVNFVTEFLFDRFVVFRNSINTNKLGQRENDKALLRDIKISDTE